MKLDLERYRATGDTGNANNDTLGVRGVASSRDQFSGASGKAYEPAGLVRGLRHLGFRFSLMDEARCALLPVSELSSQPRGRLYGRFSK